MPIDPQPLAEALRAGRESAGLSVRQLELQSGVSKSTISRLENGGLESTASKVLIQLAGALELRAADLFLLAGLAVPADLPSLPAMLRAEYDLPPDAIAEIQKSIERVARKYAKRAASRRPVTKQRATK